MEQQDKVGGSRCFVGQGTKGIRCYIGLLQTNFENLFDAFSSKILAKGKEQVQAEAEVFYAFVLDQMEKTVISSFF